MPAAIAATVIATAAVVAAGRDRTAVVATTCESATAVEPTATAMEPTAAAMEPTATAMKPTAAAVTAALCNK